MSFRPYSEAAKVDQILERLAQTEPPSEENLAEWTLFHRTIQSSLNIIERKLEQVVEQKRAKEAG